MLTACGQKYTVLLPPEELLQECEFVPSGYSRGEVRSAMEQEILCHRADKEGLKLWVKEVGNE